jgi:hypothetical protein
VTDQCVSDQRQTDACIEDFSLPSPFPGVLDELRRARQIEDRLSAGGAGLARAVRLYRAGDPDAAFFAVGVAMNLFGPRELAFLEEALRTARGRLER